MIEMVYEAHRAKPIVLNEGVYKGHNFAVVSLGSHPTAYAECKFKDVMDYTDEKICNLEVNGGLTYFGEDYWHEEHDGKSYAGWDYAHCWDWANYFSEEENIAYGLKKHTTEEMTEECYRAIDQLIEIESVL